MVSCVGYLALYLASMQLGQWLFRKRKTVAEFYPVVVFLGVGVVLLWTLTSVCEVHVQPVSRRMANLPFILWLVRNPLAYIRRCDFALSSPSVFSSLSLFAAVSID